MGDDAGQQQQVDHRGAEGEGAAEVDAGGHAHPGYGYPPHMRPPPPGSYPGYPPAPGGPPGAPQGQPGGYPPPRRDGPIRPRPVIPEGLPRATQAGRRRRDIPSTAAPLLRDTPTPLPRDITTPRRPPPPGAGARRDLPRRPAGPLRLAGRSPWPRSWSARAGRTPRAALAPPASATAFPRSGRSPRTLAPRTT